jgi:S-adenosylmethionine:tRNA-ribosyltransferase-isomerase (queuine synthetase)
MKLSQFRFKLPEELIAQYPTRYREDARMLVLHRKTGEIEHKNVMDILQYFDDITEEDDVPNNSLLREFIGKSVFFK